MIEITKNQGTIANTTIQVTGGCHCGAVRFIAQVDPKQTLLNCNCTLCSMTGHLHMMAKHENFVLHTDKNNLISYRFNTQKAEHLFCSQCGVKSFYQPRSHPDSWSINAHCVTGFKKEDWQIETFDGQNWEQAKAKLNKAKLNKD
ncbi:GFA family protein [Marinicella rhabdoformis]|uniref:GFA family protein n=1 Tax=Marinicella rhabdoformis TaxID=2580566 RepID=UPI0012AED331|nr:GFA family protein [Marinicella rhabdoformis]